MRVSLVDRDRFALPPSSASASVAAGTFGLSPRVPSSTRALSSQAHPRSLPSPLPTAPIHTFPSSHATSTWTMQAIPPQPLQTSPAEQEQHSTKRRSSTSTTNTFAAAAPFNPFSDYAPSSGQHGFASQKEHSSPPSSAKHNGGHHAPFVFTSASASVAPFSLRNGTGGSFSSRLDEDNGDLKLWRQQQKLLDIQQRNFSLLKYGFLCTALMMAVIILYLVSLQSPATQWDSFVPRSVVGLQARVLETLSSATSREGADGVGAGPPEPEDPAARLQLAEWTRKQSEEEREALYELDQSALSVEVAPDDARIASLNPVQRATALIPSPHGLQDEGFDAHAYASRHAPRQVDDAVEEPAALLRRLAEEQAASATEALEALESELGVAKTSRSVNDGATGDGEEEGLLRVPPPPQPQQATHLVIEQLIHAHTVEGAEPRAHSHKDHPSVPKYGKGMPVIPMPEVDKDTRRRWEAAKAAIAAQEKAAAKYEKERAKAKLAAERAAANPTPTPAPETAAHAAEPLVAEVTVPASATKVSETTEASASKKDSSSTPEVVSADNAKVEPTPVSTPAADEPEVEEDMLSQLLEATRPHEASDLSDQAAAKANKLTGLKGPVLRGANAEASQAAALEGMIAAPGVTGAAEIAPAPGADHPTTPGTTTTPANEAGKRTPTGATERQVSSQASRKASEAEWSATKGRNLIEKITLMALPAPPPGAPAPPHSTTLASPTAPGFMFGDDVQFLVLTSQKNQGLARKMQALYSPLIKRLTFVSDKRDTGLNATVVVNPHADWEEAVGSKDAPWRIYELFKLLLDPKRAPHGEPSTFYFILHDTTFPLLDQIRWRLDKYLAAYHGSHPNFVGGRKTASKFAKTFWTDQQEAGAKVFDGKKLFVVPTYMYGFDHTFLRAVSDFTSAASCPPLSTEGQTVGGLVECAGGVLEQTEYDFILQTRGNHREKGLTPQSPLAAWRGFDAYNGCNTPGMLQEAYDAYYGRLQPPIPTTPAPAATPAAEATPPTTAGA